MNPGPPGWLDSHRFTPIYVSIYIHLGQESLAVTAITGASAGTVDGSTSGSHGTLTMNANGTYSYEATNDALDPGETVTDVFTYTVKDDE